MILSSIHPKLFMVLIVLEKDPFSVFIVKKLLTQKIWFNKSTATEISRSFGFIFQENLVEIVSSILLKIALKILLIFGMYAINRIISNKKSINYIMILLKYLICSSTMKIAIKQIPVPILELLSNKGDLRSQHVFFNLM